MGILIFFSLIFSIDVNCKVKELDNSNLQFTQKQLSVLNSEINKLEKSLEEKNQQLLKNIQAKQDIQERLDLLKKNLEESNKKHQVEIVAVRKHFHNILIGEIDENEFPSKLIGKNIFSKILHDRIRRLRQIQIETSAAQKELMDLHKRFDSFILVENDLTQLLDSLEKRKKRLAENYYQIQEEKEKMLTRLTKIERDRLKKRITARNQLREGFSTPLEDYMDVSFKDKGLTFKFQGLNQVFASRDGQVVYSGNLSTYGNVVMIDHGKNTRSIILGDFEINVKKGDLLKKGQIIGHTKGKTSKQGTIYFEVRNRDKAQKTISLMEKDFYQNHKIKML